VNDEFILAAPQWPDPPAEEAYYGLAGDVVRAIGPHTEASPVALLIPESGVKSAWCKSKRPHPARSAGANFVAVAGWLRQGLAKPRSGIGSEARENELSC
jgi:hypothetical protein